MNKIIMIYLSFMVFSVSAMMPMSPKLDSKTRQEIIAALSKSGMAETPASAVMRTLENILSDGKEARVHSYKEKHEHLPLVEGKSTLAGERCMDVNLTAWMRAQPKNQILLQGKFCRTENKSDYEWRSDKFAVTGHL